jgi:hypothetical protein
VLLWVHGVAHRSRNIGVVAAASELTKLVFYGLRIATARWPPLQGPTPAASSAAPVA